MADDKNNDLDPEEENNDPLEDEDFGLPDLEYDELDDDDDFEDEFDNPETESAFDDPDETEEITDPQEVDEALEVEDTFGEPEEELGEESEELAEVSEEQFEDFESELEGDEFDLTEDELQKELEELEAEGLDFSDLEEMEGDEQEGDEFYEQESYDEFSDENVLDSVFGTDDDTPGTTAGYSPDSGLQRDISAKQKAASQYASSYSDGGEGKGRFARIVIIGTIVILMVAGALWFIDSSNDGKQKQVARTETKKDVPRKKSEVKKEDPKPTDQKASADSKKPTQTKAEAKPKPKQAKKPAATPTSAPAGTVNQLEQRTGKAYVIIGSFVDGDMALDFANKLANDGKSPYVLPPFNNGLYYRVAIAEYPTFDDAAQNLDQYKGEFGQDVWTLRY